MKDNINVEVIKAGKTGLFCNYIFKAIPLAFDESMSYYECLCGLLNYLKNTIIPTVNNNADEVAELQILYEQLRSFVDNYFTNLDVQEEINNKLDEMVKDGTFENILTNYSNITRVYNTHQDLVNDANALVNNMKVKTLGYYEINDGGGAEYYITDTLDETKYQEKVNDLYAELIIKNDTINFKQLGAKCNEKIDCKSYLDLYIDICNKYDKAFKLVIDEGIWYFSPTLLYRKDGVWIEGCGKFRSTNGKTTQISPLSENQPYIWKLGGTHDLSGVSSEQIVATRSCIIKKLCFAGNNVNGNWSIVESAFYIDCCMYCTFDELYFQNIWGTALTIRQSWELYWGILNFRGIGDFTKPCLHIAPTTDPYQGIAENVSANYFNYMMFEGIDGDYIYSEGISGFEHNEINNIQIELSTCSGQRGTTNTKFNKETYQNRTNMTPNFIFKGFARYLVINIINIFTTGGFYSTNNGNNYYIGGVIGNDENETSDYYSSQDIAVNMLKISSRGDYPLSAVYSHNVHYNNSLISLTNVTYYGNVILLPFDVVGGTLIKIGNYFNGNNVLPDNSLTKGYELYKFASNNVLYYDEDSISLTKMVLAGNIEHNLLALAFFYCEGNKNFKLRIKGENGIEYKFRLQGYVNNELKNIYFSYTGSGNWEYYTCENCNFDDGKIVQLIGSIVNGTTLKFDTIELINVT